MVHLQGDFKWREDKEPCLKNMEIAVPSGALVGIIGQVGSGKSSIMNAIMGELWPCGDSRCMAPRKIAYSSQNPYLFEGSVKENILKGDDFDKERYAQALHAACLSRDLRQLPGGDSAPVGARGGNLSGGQRARVSLARAIYTTSCDLLLIDDPFAAVDAETGRHLNEHLLHGPLMKGRTGIVACQPDNERMMRFDWVVVLKEGRMVAQGKPLAVIESSEYKALLSGDGAFEQEMDEQTKNTASDMTQNEEQVQDRYEAEGQGRASMNSTSWFMRQGGWYNIVLSMFFFMLMNIVVMVESTQLSAWMSHASAYEVGLTPIEPKMGTYISRYLFWMFIGLAFWTVGFSFGQTWSINTSNVVYRCMAISIMNAPIDGFFDKTPTGRIMNRMTTDMNAVDLSMFMGMCGAFGTFWAFVIPMFYVHLMMPLWFSVLGIPFYMLVGKCSTLYWKTMVPMKYLILTSKAMVSSAITDAESSPSSIRAYNMEQYRLTAFANTMRKMIAANFLTDVICVRWVVNRLFLLSAIFVTIIVLLCVWIPNCLDVGSASLVINLVFSLLFTVEGMLNTFSGSQMLMICMNRVYEYTALPEEREARLPTDAAFMNWNVSIPRAMLGRLDSGTETLNKLQGPDGVQIIRVEGYHEEPLLKQASLDSASFVAMDGKSLADLAPRCKELRKCSSWHRLIRVNGAYRSAEDIADELCSGNSFDLLLEVRSGWLADGTRIDVQNLRVGYGDLPRDVLQGVSLVVPRKNKAAIVGPTGCGKSTMLLSFLRILEPRGGRIYIEGVDTQTIGLRTLRQSIGLVPQEPVMLQGSLRFNIDPFERYDDKRIWEALKLVQMEDYVVKNMGGTLDCKIQDGGDLLSFGQRQLLSMARNIVSRPSLLLLDEATSALDPNTQKILQNSVEEQFEDASMVVIAHRLETILNFDIVVVLDAGKVVEQGPLKEVAQLKDGRFAKMLAVKGISV